MVSENFARWHPGANPGVDLLAERQRSLHWHAGLCPAPWIAGRLETGTLHSAFAATDDGRTRGDGARQPERASLVRVGALSKRPQRPVRFSIWSLAPV